jgi:hypothetical protein
VILSTTGGIVPEPEALPESTFGGEVECPWCHRINRDANEYFDGNHETAEVECGWCEKPITITQIVSVDYKTTTR